MNFKLKVLLAATALAVAGQASAAIDSANPNNSNGELFVDVTDTIAGISFTGDLGAPTTVLNSAYIPTDPRGRDFTVAATSAPGTTYVWDLTSFAAWSTFKAAATEANAVYDVLGGWRNTTGAANGQALLTTSYNPINSSGAGSVTNAFVSNTLSILSQNFLDGAAGVNSKPGMVGIANGSITAVAADGFAYTGTSKGDYLFASSVKSTDSVANSLSFYQLVKGSTNNLAKAVVTQYAGSWSLDYAGNTLSYSVAAPVPEADTWAMMLAGLMVVGGITRRRMSA